MKTKIKKPIVEGVTYYTKEGMRFLTVAIKDGIAYGTLHLPNGIHYVAYNIYSGRVERGAMKELRNEAFRLEYEEWEPLRFEPVLVRSHTGALPGIRFYWKDSYCYHHGMERAKEGKVARWEIIEPFIGDLPRDVAKMRDELICARSGYEK